MISKYLFDNYYAHTNQKDIIPTKEQIDQAVANHPDKLIIIGKRKHIKGIAMFLRLTDQTYSFLHNIDIKRIDVLQALSLENGPNFHAVLVTADGYRTLRLMYKQVMKLNPKTLSWWNPSFTKLHRYICRSYHSPQL